MREILFRGKAANRIEGYEYRTNYRNGDWVYGLLTEVENYAGFSVMANTNGIVGIEVDKQTIGQYTGLTDKNGKKIFEGDKVKYRNSIFEVRLYNGCWVIWNHKHEYEFEKYHFLSTYADLIEVIGNIYDNPELLKESE